MKITKQQLREMVQEVINEAEPAAIEKAVESDAGLEELLTAMAERVAELENQRVEIFSLKEQLRTAKSERDEFQQQEHKENKSLPQRLIALWEGKTSERPERNDIQQQQEKQGTTKGDETLLNETEAFGDGDGEKVGGVTARAAVPLAATA